jgi:hypothetical protein
MALHFRGLSKDFLCNISQRARPDGWIRKLDGSQIIGSKVDFGTRTLDDELPQQNSHAIPTPSNEKVT